MGRRALTYSGGLIALYLVVRYSTGAGTVVSKSATGGRTLIKTFQGR